MCLMLTLTLTLTLRFFFFRGAEGNTQVSQVLYY